MRTHEKKLPAALPGILIACTLLTGPSAHATLTAVDDFDYATGTTLDSSLSGGIGWSGGYYSDNALSTSPTVFGVTNYTWTTPTFANTSGTYVIQNKRSVDTTGSGSAYAGRGLGSGINFDADGTYYFSYTMKTVSGIGQELDFFAGASEILSVQYLGGGNTLRMTSTDSSNSGTISATAGNDWFVVGKIETSAAGNDIFRLSVFETGDTVAATEGGWDLSLNGGSIGGTVDQIVQWKYFNTNVGIGNLRLGTDYASVTSVIPEPSTLLLVVTALGGFALLRRRRMQ